MGGAELVHEIRRIDPGAAGDRHHRPRRRRRPRGRPARGAPRGAPEAGARSPRLLALLAARAPRRARRRSSRTTLRLSDNLCEALRARGFAAVTAALRPRDRAARAGAAVLRARRPPAPRRPRRRGDAPARRRSIPGLPHDRRHRRTRRPARRAARGVLHEAVRHRRSCSPPSSGCTARAAEASAADDARRPKQPRVLVVDDNAALVDNLAGDPRGRRATPCTARAPAPPRSRLAARRLRRRARRPAAPRRRRHRPRAAAEGASPPDGEVVLLTGFATLESAVAAVRAGACAYLVKPCATQELLVTVEQAMRQVRLHEEKRELAPPRADGREARRGRDDDRRPLARDPQPAQRRRPPALGARAARPAARARTAQAAAPRAAHAREGRDPPARSHPRGLPPVRPAARVRAARPVDVGAGGHARPRPARRRGRAARRPARARARARPAGRGRRGAAPAGAREPRA